MCIDGDNEILYRSLNVKNPNQILIWDLITKILRTPIIQCKSTLYFEISFA